ncbi:unnamed protein product [Macrosiphum euphorbiae]|uniref:Uncharacterized protein n=1 Tax=Macrosiphum euphorbiae TaxID=13131 RepID=A0AAV0VG01_9HEMI|nr:unnamed protein product [Macrosiphum euphorbiae]
MALETPGGFRMANSKPTARLSYPNSANLCWFCIPGHANLATCCPFFNLHMEVTLISLTATSTSVSPLLDNRKALFSASRMSSMVY